MKLSSDARQFLIGSAFGVVYSVGWAAVIAALFFMVNGWFRFAPLGSEEQIIFDFFPGSFVAVFLVWPFGAFIDLPYTLSNELWSVLYTLTIILAVAIAVIPNVLLYGFLGLMIPGAKHLKRNGLVIIGLVLLGVVVAIIFLQAGYCESRSYVDSAIVCADHFTWLMNHRDEVIGWFGLWAFVVGALSLRFLLGAFKKTPDA